MFDFKLTTDHDKAERQRQIELYNSLPDFPTNNRIECNWCKWSTDKCTFTETAAGLHLLNWTCYRCGGITHSKTANVHYKES